MVTLEFHDEMGKIYSSFQTKLKWPNAHYGFLCAFIIVFEKPFSHWNVNFI